MSARISGTGEAELGEHRQHDRGGVGVQLGVLAGGALQVERVHAQLDHAGGEVLDERDLAGEGVDRFVVGGGGHQREHLLDRGLGLADRIDQLTTGLARAGGDALVHGRVAEHGGVVLGGVGRARDPCAVRPPGSPRW